MVAALCPMRAVKSSRHTGNGHRVAAGRLWYWRVWRCPFMGSQPPGLNRPSAWRLGQVVMGTSDCNLLGRSRVVPKTTRLFEAKSVYWDDHNDPRWSQLPFNSWSARFRGTLVGSVTKRKFNVYAHQSRRAAARRY